MNFEGSTESAAEQVNTVDSLAAGRERTQPAGGSEAALVAERQSWFVLDAAVVQDLEQLHMVADLK